MQSMERFLLRSHNTDSLLEMVALYQFIHHGNSIIRIADNALALAV